MNRYLSTSISSSTSVIAAIIFTPPSPTSTVEPFIQLVRGFDVFSSIKRNWTGVSNSILKNCLRSLSVMAIIGCPFEKWISSVLADYPIIMQSFACKVKFLETEIDDCPEQEKICFLLQLRSVSMMESPFLQGARLTWTYCTAGGMKRGNVMLSIWLV